MTRFQFVADHRDTFEVKRMCKVVQIARSGFYAWVAAAPARAARQQADEALAARVRAVHALSATHRAYGAPRVTAELNEATDTTDAADTVTGSTGSSGSTGRVNHKRVARVMAAAGISGVRLRRRVVTTVPDPDRQPVPDLLERDFTAAAPNLKYVGDITYLPCAGSAGAGGASSFVYLATVIDCASRRLVGWSIAEHMRTELVADALAAAAATRGSLAGAIFHSDHGAQYGAKSYAQLCDQLGVRRSMGAVGTSADNALAESFNAALQRETLAGATGWDSPQQARREVFAWLARYNTARRHSACGQRPPTAYEAHHLTSTLPIAA